MKKALKKIDNKWVRLTVMVIVGINTIAVMLGYNLLPFSNEQIITGLSVAALIVSEVWNHWKNNSWSDKAKQADNYLESIK